MLLPFVEQQNLAAMIDFNRPITDPINTVPRSTVIAAYRCPSDTAPDRISVHPPALNITDMAACSYIDHWAVAIRPMHRDIRRCTNSSHSTESSIEIRPFVCVIVTDGTSNTFGIGERQSAFSPNGLGGCEPRSTDRLFSTGSGSTRCRIIPFLDQPSLWR